MLWDLETVGWDNHSAHLICPLFLRDDCSLLSDLFRELFCFFFVFVLNRKANLFPLIPSCLEMKIHELFLVLLFPAHFCF